MKNKLFTCSKYVFLIIFISSAIIYTGKTFWFCNNELLLNTTDAMPIYTKVIYIADCIRNMQWPSWFPNWYCGSSVSQYYPPFTYILLTPLELVLKNPTMCLKIYIFLGLLIGGIGIWKIFSKYIGNTVFSILASVLYVALPYFTISFLFWGTVAQVPIIAIAPWYVICCMNYYKTPKSTTWLAIIALTFMLLLSHVMHGFMIAIYTFLTLLILSIKNKKNFAIILMWGIGTGLAAGILGFWWVTGVLPLENPGVPSLATDAIKDVTANFSWFFPRQEDIIQKVFPEMKNNISAYFPCSIILIAICSVVFIRKEDSDKKYVLIFLYIHTIITFIFSFGMFLPFFKWIPLANKLVPGRILTQTAIGASILTAYFISVLAYTSYKKISVYSVRQVLKKAFAVLLIMATGLITVISYCHYPQNVITYFSEESLYSQLDNKSKNFDKGRLAWFGDNFSSINAYLAYVSSYNIVSGWNIEGTSTAPYLIYQNTALSYKKGEYLLKNIYDMNVQTCLVNTKDFPWLYDLLKNNHFKEIGAYENIAILKREDQSYFMEQPRNSIVIGKASDLLLSDYPWFVKGYDSNPTKYEMEYFDNYNLIYYCDPKINNLNELQQFEDQITKLTKKGKKIIVEFGREGFPDTILGVSKHSLNLEGTYSVLSEDEFNGDKFYVGADAGEILQLFGMDDVTYQLKRDFGNLTIDFIGTKNIGENKVFFLGGPQSQLKRFSFNYLTGSTGTNDILERRDEIIFYMTQKLFNDSNLYKDLRLPTFNAEEIKWGANSCEFWYQSDISKRVMASITYTPRWRIFVDGIETKVERVENMLSFNLPEGKHKVNMVYTSTTFGKIGIAITIFSTIMILVIQIFYKKVFFFLSAIVIATAEYMEFHESRNL